MLRLADRECCVFEHVRKSENVSITWHCTSTAEANAA